MKSIKMDSLHLHFIAPLILWSTTFLAVCVYPVCCNNSCAQDFSCGNVSVGFPFWGGSLRPKNCGYPDFELSCESNNATTIEMKSMKYRVLKINPSTKVMRIAREDLYEGICLHKFVNTTLNFEQFNYALGSQNITILYGCQSLSDGYGGSSTVPGQFTCRISGVTETTGFYQSGASGPNGCYKSVVVPVLASSEVQINSVGLSQVIDQGFEASYNVKDEGYCKECGASMGQCGFDVIKNKATCLCPNGSAGSTSCNSNPGVPPHKRRIVLGLILGGLATVICILVVSCFMWRFSSGIQELFKRKLSPGSQDIEVLLRNYGSLAPKRYTYKCLKKATTSFKDKLGEGGYGTVYQGKLCNGHQVAVKLLKKSTENAEEFINEVTSIGQTNHVNVVRLLGFCFEGRQRALVYEFMPNGSLEKFLYRRNDRQSLACDKLFEIAVGVARGLEYLHRGCNTRIVHFDIKPHNILLDEDLCPKISDFGLAKSSQHRDSSIISMSVARGTVGFIAPEVYLKCFGGVSHKSDVYSYGMLVLEMVGCRQNVKDEFEHSSEQYFPHWIYKQLEQVPEPDQQGILNRETNEIQRKMITLSLWCIQTNPSSRPTMSRVVEMLEGPLESLEIPPMPSLSSPSMSKPNSSLKASDSSYSCTTSDTHINQIMEP